MANPRHIYAVRHAERLDDINEVWYYNSRFGRDNPPLSETGQKQAEELKKKFCKTHIDFCFSSPYERCIQTASKILEGRVNGCQINVEPGFLESGFLVYERGAKMPSFEKTRELAQRYPNVNLNYNQLFLAQTQDEFNANKGVRCCFPRINHTLTQLVKCCQGDILIVTHKHPMAAIQSFLTNSDNLIYPGPATVSKFEEQPGRTFLGRPLFTAAYLGDSSHLSDIGKSIDGRVK